MVKNILIVGAGGAIGAILRYLNSKLILHYFGASFPLATLIVNVLGCFLMGLAYMFFINKVDANSESLKLFIMMGVLGALTTFSTFSMESVLLLSQGEYIKSFSYFFLTFILCFAAFFIGMKFSG